ncbi:hypothetical protein Pmani_029802 [Petrolisthes manimaculis]|uniref:NADH dehydrogenase [ubiquinone] 1 alpha subcomplex subunit 8 n=1 Tax=Petrolisthes manimaculis TaxID=1843537 RepID=A0AAE1TTH7_9EUCA|nr:hypothetical protein Pmani_029802 [Petrolisthes manimaculis]
MPRGTGLRMFTKDFELPTEEELTVQEVNVTTSSLRAGAFHLGKSCEKENHEFILCREEEKDPRKCLKEGKDVTSCALNFFRKVKKSCLEEFSQYAHCLDQSSKDLNYRYCRNTQAIFDKCVLENLNLERPEFGYFSRAQVIQTDRPKPEGYTSVEYPDAPPPIPEVDRPRAKYGLRNYWMT